MTRRDLATWIPFALSIGVLLYLLVTDRFLARTPPGIALQVAGIAVSLWARAAFRLRSLHAGATPTAGGLVTHGPYRYVRHPVYLGILLLTAGAVVSHASWPVAIAGLLLAALTVTRALLEERLLTARYPEYADYAARTARFVPHLL